MVLQGGGDYQTYVKNICVIPEVGQLGGGLLVTSFPSTPSNVITLW